MANIKKIRTTSGDLAIDYESTENKPQINGIELTGNKAPSAFGLALEIDVKELQKWLTEDPVAGDPYYLEAVGEETDPEPATPEIIISNTEVSFTETTQLVLQVKLNSQPSATTTLNFASAGITCSPTSMQFTTDNWNTYQALVLSYSGSDLTSNKQDTVNVTASGGDYQGLSKTISVTVIAETTEPSIIISSKTVSFKESSNNTVQISLGGKPTEEVTLTLTATNDVSVSPSSITYSSSNYTTPKVVTISYTGTDLEEDLSSVITVTASGGSYEGLSDAINVTVQAETSPSSGGHFNVRSATKEDFEESINLTSINIESDGKVTGSGSGMYPLLITKAVGDTAVLEFEVDTSAGLWVICGKNESGGVRAVGFGDANMGTIGYYGTFASGGLEGSATSGAVTDTNNTISTKSGTKIHIERTGTIVSVYEYTSEWELKFQADLAKNTGLSASDYNFNSVGIIYGSGTYLTIKNAKVLGS